MKHAVFYCENCGKPVPLDAEECPHCGSRFTAVQCPQCSFVGAARLFSAGCPQCGYLSPDLTQRRAGVEVVQSETKPAQSGAAPVQRRGDAPGPTQPVRRYRKGSNRLPGWFYTLASIALLAALIVLTLIALHLK